MSLRAVKDIYQTKPTIRGSRRQSHAPSCECRLGNAPGFPCKKEKEISMSKGPLSKSNLSRRLPNNSMTSSHVRT